MMYWPSGLVHASMRKAKCVRVFFVLFTATSPCPAQRVVSTLTQAQAAACEERDPLSFQQRGCNPPRGLRKLWLGSAQHARLSGGEARHPSPPQPYAWSSGGSRGVNVSIWVVYR